MSRESHVPWNRAINKTFFCVLVFQTYYRHAYRKLERWGKETSRGVSEEVLLSVVVSRENVSWESQRKKVPAVSARLPIIAVGASQWGEAPIPG
jgi:hypothetical protein